MCLLEKGLQSEWQTVFIITIVVYVVGAIGYCIWGTAETEPYAQAKSNNVDEEHKPEENLPLRKSSF